MKIKKALPILLTTAIAGCVIGGTVSACKKNGGDKPGPLPEGKKIYVVGDSTVCGFADPYYIPRYGYGTQLAEYLNVTSDQIVNLALSGRSSKSFLTEENYTTLTSSIASGDYLIIGFGHNDEKSAEPARFTDPAGTHTEETTAKGTSFKYSLYQNYVKMAKDKGATPILCTPIVRYSDVADYTGAKAHITADGDYAAAIRELGTATDTTVVDLTTLTKTLYEADNENAQYFHAFTTYKESGTDKLPEGRDDTHINKYGAKMVAYQFANAIKETENSLKLHVKDNIAAPTKEADYPDAIDTAFVKAAYTPFNPEAYEESELGGGWYKTVMGEVGGVSKIANYSITSADGKFSVGTETNSGKFAKSQDGFGAAFMQVSVTKNFTIKATATVTAANSGSMSNQSGYGIMLRDDILVDTYDKTLNHNYVAAGIIHTKGKVFSREGAADLKVEYSGADAIAVGDTTDFEIVRVGQTVTVKVAGCEDKVFTDFDFVAIDNDYMYICLFANRGLVVEFSNVVYTETGTSQGA